MPCSRRMCQYYVVGRNEKITHFEERFKIILNLSSKCVICFVPTPIQTLNLKIQLFASNASIAQLGERQTEDLKVPGSIPGGGNFLFLNLVTVRVGVRVRGRIWVRVRVRG